MPAICYRFLLGGFGRKIPGVCSHMITPIICLQIDGAEGPILLEVGGPVVQQILATEFFLDACEACRNIFYPCREEGTSASRLGDRLQHVVALIFAGADVG